MIRRSPSPALLAVLAASACGGGDPATPRPATSKPAAALVHDFGTVRHGQTRSHVYEVPMPDDSGGWIPVGFAQGCTCATHHFEIVGPSGERRLPTGQPFGTYAVRDGERLLLHVDLDTNKKEPASRPSVTIDGTIVLQTEASPFRRAELPVRFRFAIEAPIEVLPAATVDLGRVPRHLAYGRTYSLRPNGGSPTYGAVRCLERDPEHWERFRESRDITLELETDGDGTTLRVAIHPAADRPIGPFTAYATIETGLDDGYVLRIPISGTIVPDVEIAPPGRIAFGQIDLARPRTGQVIVIDHDTSRAAEFWVTEIVDHTGADVSGHFDVRFEPVPEQPRARALLLDYRGTLAGPRFLRGAVRLAKAPGGETVESVEYSAYQSR